VDNAIAQLRELDGQTYGPDTGAIIELPWRAAFRTAA
jgi:hypothetical protein